MNIPQSDITNIERIIDAAGAVGITTIVMDPTRVAGVSDDSNIIMLQTTDVPQFEFGSIGVNRASAFKARLNLVKDNHPTFSVVPHTITVEGEAYPFVRSITMASKTTKVEFRCANPLTIRAPKRMVNPIHYYIPITPEWLDRIVAAQNAMNSDLITLKFDGETFSAELSDSNGDVYSEQDPNLSSTIVQEDVATGSFKIDYKIKDFINMCRKLTPDVVMITQDTLLVIEKDSINFYLRPVV